VKIVVPGALREQQAAKPCFGQPKSAASRGKIPPGRFQKLVHPEARVIVYVSVYEQCLSHSTKTLPQELHPRATQNARKQWVEAVASMQHDLSSIELRHDRRGVAIT
jgi:hypothetical protein